MCRRWRLGLVLLALFLAACRPAAPAALPPPLALVEFNRNGATVTLVLEQDGQGGSVLAATFTPDEADGHLYSKDLPIEGVDGLGRPTLLELAPGTGIQPLGDLQDSAVAESVDVAPGLPALPVYPAGPVTLRLPVRLPGQASAEQILITYMVCTPRGCYRPVVARAVDVQVPAVTIEP